jgi:ParB-like chromosome segregation protein Spo0J
MNNLEIKFIKLEALKPFSKNPRKNEKAIQPVMKSIQEFGFNVPILVSKDFEIIAGHTRFEAAKKLGLIKVPVIILEHLDEIKKIAFNIADNKIIEYSRWDYDKLKEVFVELKNEDYPLENTLFQINEVETFLTSWSVEIDKLKPNDYEDSPIQEKIIITCNKSDFQELRDFIELKLKETNFEGIKIL